MAGAGGVIPPALLDESRVPKFYHEAVIACGATNTNMSPNTALGLFNCSPIKYDVSVYNLMVTSGLPRHILAHIWSTVNRTRPGQLTRAEFYSCLALIALAQVSPKNVRWHEGSATRKESRSRRCRPSPSCRSPSSKPPRSPSSSLPRSWSRASSHRPKARPGQSESFITCFLAPPDFACLSIPFSCTPFPFPSPNDSGFRLPPTQKSSSSASRFIPTSLLSRLRSEPKKEVDLIGDVVPPGKKEVAMSGTQPEVLPGKTQLGGDDRQFQKRLLPDRITT